MRIGMRPAARGVADRAPPIVRWRCPALVVVGLGTFLTSADASVVGALLPLIGGEFHASPGRMAWVPLSYLLIVAALVLPAGRLSDRYGHRRLYLTGASLHLAGTLCTAGATSLGILIACRALTALGAVLLLANAAAVVTLSSAVRARGKALGWLSSAAYCGLTFGPVVGGWLAAAYGWRRVLLAIVPIAGLTLVFALAGLRYDGRADASQGRPNLRLLRDTRVVLASAVALLAYGALYCVTFLLPFWLRQSFALDPGRAGLVLAARSAATALVAPLAGAAVDRVGTRWPSAGGLLVLAAGIAGLAASGERHVLPVVAALLAIGIGVGTFLPANHRAVIAAASPAGYGVASAMLTFNRNLGTLCGTALAGWLVASDALTRAMGVSGARSATQSVFVFAAMIAASGAIVAWAGGADPASLTSRATTHTVADTAGKDQPAAAASPPGGSDALWHTRS